MIRFPVFFILLFFITIFGAIFGFNFVLFSFLFKPLDKHVILDKMKRACTFSFCSQALHKLSALGI